MNVLAMYTEQRIFNSEFISYPNYSTIQLFSAMVKKLRGKYPNLTYIQHQHIHKHKREKYIAITGKFAEIRIQILTIIKRRATRRRRRTR